MVEGTISFDFAFAICQSGLLLFHPVWWGGALFAFNIYLWRESDQRVRLLVFPTLVGGLPSKPLLCEAWDPFPPLAFHYKVPSDKCQRDFENHFIYHVIVNTTNIIIVVITIIIIIIFSKNDCSE